MDEKSLLLADVREGQENFRSVYKPLDSENIEIRLLLIPFSIKQSLGQGDPIPLSGKLVHYNLPLKDGSVPKKLLQAITRPMYHALSYVWGDRSQREEIIIDGKPISITRSLYTALRQLQMDAFGEEFVWADAICINQEDDFEKSAQIRIMREIYHNAASVRVWLGSGGGEEGELFKCFNFIATLTNSPEPDEYKYGEEWYNEILLPMALRPLGLTAQVTLSAIHKARMFTDTFKGVSADEKAQLISSSERKCFVKEYLGWKPKPKDLVKAREVLGDDDFTSIAKSIEKTIIVDPEWFTRIWVVQEVGVAHDDVEVCRGVYNTGWENLLNTIFYLHYQCNIPFPSIDRIASLETIRAAFLKGKRRRLRHLMYECRYRQATNPIDKIYGLYGLMGDHINDFIKPDYSKSVEEVYSHTALHFITQAQSLNSICGQQTVGRRQGLPSWVPDFGLDPAPASVPLMPPDGEDLIFNASGHDKRSNYLLPDPSLSLIEWSVLPTQGICIGTVNTLSGLARDEDSFSIVQKKWRIALDQKLTIMSSGTDESPVTSLDEIGEIVEKYSKFYTASFSTSAQAQTSHSPPRTNSTFSTSNHNEKDTLTSVVPETTAPPLPPLTKSTPSLNKQNTKTTNPIAQAYFETLLTGRLTASHRTTPTDITHLLAHPSSPSTPLPSLSLKITPSPTPHSHTYTSSLCISLEAGMRRRRFLLTSDGKMGAGPEQTEIGDLIVVLFGCSVPVVLRKREKKDEYFFVGECYVNGFMDAEAIAWMMRGRYVVTDFRLV